MPPMLKEDIEVADEQPDLVARHTFMLRKRGQNRIAQRFDHRVQTKIDVGIHDRWFRNNWPI